MDLRDANSPLWNEAIRLVLSLSIFMGAFALDGNKSSVTELLRAVVIVAPTLTFLLLIWFDVLSLAEKRPPHNPRFLHYCLAASLATAVLPATMKAMTVSPTNFDWASRAYAADVAAIYLILSYLTHRLLVLPVPMDPAEREYTRLKRGRRLILAGVFALSLLVPSGAAGSMPLREIAWLGSFFVPRLYTLRGTGRG